MGLMDKLKGVQAKQETIETQKKTEDTKMEREQKRSELTAERNTMMENLKQSEKDAEEAENALKEAEAYVAEKGDALDAEAKTEIEGIKSEANEILAKFNELKSKVENLNAQIASFEENQETIAAEASVEKPVEVSMVEVIQEVPKVAEVVQQEQVTETPVAQKVETPAVEASRETDDEYFKRMSSKFANDTRLEYAAVRGDQKPYVESYIANAEQNIAQQESTLKQLESGTYNKEDYAGYDIEEIKNKLKKSILDTKKAIDDPEVSLKEYQKLAEQFKNTGMESGGYARSFLKELSDSRSIKEGVTSSGFNIKYTNARFNQFLGDAIKNKDKANLKVIRESGILDPKTAERVDSLLKE